jgi:hypothetical protein
MTVFIREAREPSLLTIYAEVTLLRCPAVQGGFGFGVIRKAAVHRNLDAIRFSRFHNALHHIVSAKLANFQ